MDIIGHEKTRDFLRRISDADLPHQAFLFSGPKGIGKSLVAKEFSSYLLGFDGSDPSEKQDFLLLSAQTGESRSKKIPVEAVRDLGIFLSRFPAEAKRRVVLVEDADLLSESAQNAILKVFEEPNPTSVIILSTAHDGAIRETIRSRAFYVPLSLVSEENIEAGARRLFPGDNLVSVEPFFFSLGRPGIVVTAARNPEAFSDKRDILRRLFRISKLAASERFRLSEELSEHVSESVEILEWWVSGLRSMKKGEKNWESIRLYYRFLEDIEETLRSLRTTNANARLLLDRLFISL